MTKPPISWGELNQMDTPDEEGFQHYQYHDKVNNVQYLVTRIIMPNPLLRTMGQRKYVKTWVFCLN